MTLYKMIHSGTRIWQEEREEVAINQKEMWEDR